ncbi:MAG: anti-sigma factor domain-containing protein [Candidatus Binataceae bacterium]
MDVEEAKSNQAERSAAPIEEAPASPRRAPWYQRASFWRAIAGMAVAAALGGVIAATETASDLFHRTTHYHHRIVQLDARVKKMRGEIAAARSDLARMRGEAAAREALSRVLAAPDARMIKLASPQAGGNTSGFVAISGKLASAAFEVSGLGPVPTDHGYVLWWLIARHAPIRAAQFHAAPDGHTAINVATPPPIGAKVIGSVVTLEPAGDVAKPGGTIVLRSGASGAD